MHTDVPPNFAGRVSQCLTQWTGQRWIVSISDKEGDVTLADIDRAAEKVRHEKASQHPLTLAVLKAFPDAKMTALRQRVVAPVVEDATKDDVIPSESDELLELMDFED